MYSYSDVHAHDMASRSTIKFLAVGDTLELVATLAEQRQQAHQDHNVRLHERGV